MTKKGRKKLYDGGVLTVRLPAETLNRIDEYAQEAGLSRADWARQCLSIIVKAQGKEFQVAVEKAMQELKPMFERLGAMLKDEIDRNPELMKASFERAFRIMAEELLNKRATEKAS